MIEKPSEALKLVREIVAANCNPGDTSVFICNELEDMVRHRVISNLCSAECKHLINRLLGYHDTYYGWLFNKIGRDVEWHQANQGRVQWVDWMIGEWKKIGK